MDLAKMSAEILGVKKVNYYKNFGTAAFRHKDFDYEFVGARKESYQRDSRKPIVEDGTLEDDQNRRDFTINALAISLQKKNFGELIDPFDGLKDLEDKLIRTPLDPDITFSDDPLRMMRAIRFASQLRFTIEQDSYNSIVRNAERIKIISMERIIDEVNKIILSPKPSVGIKHMINTGLLDYIFPEMTLLHGVESKNGLKHKDNFYHTLEVLDNITENTDNLWMRWAAILHYIVTHNTKRFQKTGGLTSHGNDDLAASKV